MPSRIPQSAQIRKAVLAYSGGLDTSIIIPWLRENYGCEVIAMVGDVGQGDDYEAVRAKAISTGASRVFVEDRRDDFLRNYVWKALQAGEPGCVSRTWGARRDGVRR